MDWKTIIEYVGGLVWTLFGAVITFYLQRFLVAHKKDKNLGLLATWAEQVVADEKNKLISGPEKKANAIKVLTEILRRNKMLSLFSEDQLSGAIEVAVNALNEFALTEGKALFPDNVDTTDKK